MRAVVLAALIAGGCTSGLGEPCDEEVPCPEGLLCRVPPNDGGLAMPAGVCDYPSKKEGERCSAGADCESQLTCSNHFAPGTRYGVCVQKLEDGAACFADRDCKGGRCLGKSGTVVDGSCGRK
ncbi:MAG: hypothetical protein HYZ28_12205 [Myxococcales bacterium]|nr:hypothetical protein [Myxococcales bacterium]